MVVSAGLELELGLTVVAGAVAAVRAALELHEKQLVLPHALGAS